jgi:pyrimidine operon attenuation protein/uracil phosphoribosyltransferase
MAKPFYHFEMIKNNVKNVKFNYEKYFENNIDKYDNEKHRKMVIGAIDDLISKIRSGDYFNMGKQKLKYRPYFYDYLIFDDEKLSNFCKIENRKILLIDDINTTGATMDEMLRYINSLNDTNEIYIFTIIGKEIN